MSIGIEPVLNEILALGRPTMLFAVPYSGHEWTSYGAMARDARKAPFDSILSADCRQLAAAVRPFRDMHLLREAKILNVKTGALAKFVAEVRDRFGTEIKQCSREAVLNAYQAVSDADAEAEARRWMADAAKIVEPSRDDILRSCKLALAFERLLAEEDAVGITVDCYGTMWNKTILLPAYPCLGFS